MQLKLRLLSDAAPDDVLVDVAPHTTIGELAAALFPSAVPAGATAADSRVRPPTSTCRAGGSSPRSSGSTSRVFVPARVVGPSVEPVEHEGADHGGHAHGARRRRRTGDVRAHRRAGRPIGRGADCDVRLTDPLVSKRHADLVIGDVVEIVDDASANGLVMSGRAVPNAPFSTPVTG